MPDGTLRMLVQGPARADRRVRGRRAVPGRADPRGTRPARAVAGARGAHAPRTDHFLEIVETFPYLPEELQIAVANVDDPEALGHMIAGSLRLRVEEKQELLEERNVTKRLRKLSGILARELEVMEIGSKIQSRSSPRWTRASASSCCASSSRRSSEELGEEDRRRPRSTSCARDRGGEAARRSAHGGRARAVEARAAPAGGRRVRRDPHVPRVDRLAAVERSGTEDNLDMAHARKVLDRDHYDIEKVKDRILEHLAVRKLKPDATGLDPVPGRSTRRRQDVTRAGRSRGRWGASSSDLGRRRPRRGRDPRPPPHLYRRAARHDHPCAARRREPQSGVHDRRDRQDGRGLPRRPGERDARGARPRAEPRLPRSLPRPAVRSLAT